MDSDQFNQIVNAIVKELSANQPVVKESIPVSIQETPKHATTSPVIQPPMDIQVPLPLKPLSPILNPVSKDISSDLQTLTIDLPDLTTEEFRSRPGIDHPLDFDGLQALMDSTPARIGYGRSGPRYRTPHWLLFQADQAITQDTLFRDVDEKFLSDLGLFTVQTCVTGGKQEYLLRPDLGRKLSDTAKQTIQQKCIKQPRIQVCVGDGLSAQAIESNLSQILPVIQQGCQTAGLSLGTPFFIQYCRVGVMNDIGDLIQPDILMLLIGERPGLGRADSMSIYMAYKPRSGHTDAERDVICNVFNGGTNPLEAGAYAVQFAQKMIQFQAAGVKLKLTER